MQTVSEVEKLSFMTEYRRICEKYDLCVVQLSREDYSPHVIARVTPDVFDGLMLEMLLEPVIYITARVE
jgi:hypothetical protein